MEGYLLRMLRRFFFLSLVPGAALLFLSCDLMEPAWSVSSGNYSYTRGRYQQATILYMDSLDYGKYHPWIYYNLGNVYTALGEGDAALAMWEKVEDSNQEELLFRLNYNRGHLYYQRGEYTLAFENFRQALKHKPASRAAKINLELALGKVQAAGGAATSSKILGEEAGQDAADRGNHKRILEYVRRKEGQPWQEPKNPQDSPGVRDW